MFDKDRTQYIARKYNVPTNAGRALQLFEAGYTSSGAANILGLTESTVAGYKSQLMEKIHPNVVMPVTRNGKHGQRFDTFPQRDRPDLDRYAGDYIEYAPEFSQRQRPLNKGVPLSEISAEHMSAPKEYPKA